jgi:hypothetical protein
MTDAEAPLWVAGPLPAFIRLYQFKHSITSPPVVYLSPPYALWADMLKAASEYAVVRHTRNRNKPWFDLKLFRWNMTKGIPYQQKETRSGSKYDQHAEYSVVTTVAAADLVQCHWLDQQQLPVYLKENQIGVEKSVVKEISHVLRV